ncbi:MFS transporter [Neptunicella marina]|uniref:MFS transporter n=1 Tax=Neptunicella marina TaxID=2125989 RepID=UPI001F512D10|nr:MFS transporter [Neptunicella marina]
MNHVDEAPLNQGMDSKPVAHWGGVFAMSLCAFAMVASEFLPVSLLTLMSDDLSVSEGAIGQGISISGLFALITALSISSLAGNLNRRTLMLGLTAIMVIASLMVGFAPNYIIYMTGRILVGIALGGFWSLSAKAAMLLVPDYAVPKALATFNAGNALAMVIAAPLGSSGRVNLCGMNFVQVQHFLIAKPGCRLSGSKSKPDDKEQKVLN